MLSQPPNARVKVSLYLLKICLQLQNRGLNVRNYSETPGARISVRRSHTLQKKRCTVAEWRGKNFSEPFRQRASWRQGSGDWQVDGGTRGLGAPDNMGIF